MPLTAQDVIDKAFHQEFRGYAREEVDDYLDVVADRITALEREREDLADQLRAAQDQAVEGAEAEGLLKRALVAAQRTADETVEEARRTAEQSLADARQEAERVRAESRAEAQQTLEGATNQAAELLAAMRRQIAAEQREVSAGAERIRRGVEDLERFRAEYLERVRGVIAEQLALLDRTGDLPEPPSALAELASLAREQRVATGGGEVGRGRLRRVAGDGGST